MLKKFIGRPILSAVVSIIIVILGFVSLNRLPLTLYPDIAPPCIVVWAMYPGANAETTARSVAPIIEEAINGVERMTYMTSNIAKDGSLGISVFFELGTDPDMAAVNVQNRVSTITNQLPEEVVKAGITTTKQQNSSIMSIAVRSTDGRYDETFLQNYANINIIPEIKRINGVGKASSYGMRDYSMRIWLKPDKLAAYSLSPDEVMQAVRDQNMEAAPGSFGESANDGFEYSITYRGKLIETEEFENIVVQHHEDGSTIYLKDIADVKLEAYSYAAANNTQGHAVTIFDIFQTAGSNANEIQTRIGKMLDQKRASVPAGVAVDIIYSSKESLDEAIHQVKSTLIEAFVLVFMVVFIFLQNIRSTVITAIAIPVSIIGTFFFMELFGFSINLLTLFALVLAVGIVVDDAVVVVEAVNHKILHQKLPAKAATESAMSEITGAVVSSTLVMMAVFAPVGFIEGSVGLFYRQFAFTMIMAIFISGINALTLSPALCALLLREDNNGFIPGENKWVHRKKRLYLAFNTAFETLTKRYARFIHQMIRHKWRSIAGLAVVSALALVMLQKTPKDFIPDEDNGFLLATLDMPAAASLDRTLETLHQADRLLHDLPFVRDIVSIGGYDIMNNTLNSSGGFIFVILKPIPERGDIRRLPEIMGIISERLNRITAGNVFLFKPPTMPGFGMLSGVDLVLQDRSAGSLENFSQEANRFVEKLSQQPEIAYAMTPFKVNYPQYEMLIDHKRVKQLGIDVSTLLGVMQVYYGSYQCSDFNRFGKYYKVIVQAPANMRKDPSSLDRIYVQNRKGENIPVSTVVQMKEKEGPLVVNRFNMFNSITVNAGAKEGYSSGELMDAVERTATEVLPASYSFEWQGMAREASQSKSQTAMIFILSIVLIFLVLSGLYESFIIPWAILLSVPTAVFGVFLAVNALGMANSIYVQVSLLMLLGLMSKNAILIVEFALQRRKDGKTLVASAIEAAKLRLRPILMTSLTFVVGLVPMVFSVGPSAVGNVAISVSALGGMLSGIIGGVLIVPVLFVIFCSLHERISGPYTISEI